MAIFWSNVAVSMQSALATAVAITGISKASPGVVSHSGTDPSDGDYVILKIKGMHQIDKRVARVASAGVGSFELEGIDTTSFGTFTSGTFEVITFGNAFNSMTDVSPSGGEPEFADTTTIHDSVRKQVPVLTAGLQIASTLIFDPSDATHQAAQSASENIEERAFIFTFSNGSKLLFNGYVSLPNVPTGQAQGLVTTPLNITADGRATTYAS